MAENHQDEATSGDHQPPQPSPKVPKTALKALILVGSLILFLGLLLASPVLIILSPVLVPVFIALFLVLVGFLAVGGLWASAVFLVYWVYIYVTGKHPIGADKVDQATEKIADAAKEVVHMVEISDGEDAAKEVVHMVEISDGEGDDE